MCVHRGALSSPHTFIPIDVIQLCMRELTMLNGRITPKIRLDCTRCDGYRRFHRDSENVVMCGECGKRHSEANLTDLNTPGGNA